MFAYLTQIHTQETIRWSAKGRESKVPEYKLRGYHDFLEL